MGLLDSFTSYAQTPNGQDMLLGLSQGLLANSGYSRMPVSLGQGLAAGLGQAVALHRQRLANQQLQAQTQQTQAQTGLLGMQSKMAQFKMNAMLDFLRHLGVGGSSGASPTAYAADAPSVAQAPMQAGPVDPSAPVNGLLGSHQLPQTAAPTPAMGASGSPLPAGMDPNLFGYLYMTDPSAATGILAKQYPGPSPIGLLAREQSALPQGSPLQPIYQGALNKAAGMGLMDVRQGGGVFDPVSGEFVAQLPHLHEGQTYSPQGQVQTAPGYLGSVRDITATTANAEAQAKSQYEPLEITNPDGSKSYLPRTALAGMGGLPGGVPGSASNVPGDLGAGIAPGAVTAQEARAKTLEEEAATLRSGADNAQAQNFQLAQMRASLNHFNPNAFANWTLAGKQVLNGIFPGAFSQSIASQQEFSKYASQLAFKQAREMGAREAATVVQQVMKSNPNATMVRPAIESLMNGMQGMNNYVLAKQQAMTQWRNAHNGQLTGFNTTWNHAASPSAYAYMAMDPQSRAQFVNGMSKAQATQLMNQIQALQHLGYLH